MFSRETTSPYIRFAIALSNRIPKNLIFYLEQKGKPILTDHEKGGDCAASALGNISVSCFQRVFAFVLFPFVSFVCGCEIMQESFYPLIFVFQWEAYDWNKSHVLLFVSVIENHSFRSNMRTGILTKGAGCFLKSHHEVSQISRYFEGIVVFQ